MDADSSNDIEYVRSKNVKLNIGDSFDCPINLT